VATSGRVDANPRIVWLALLTFAWLSGSDIIYALLDLESDRQTGVHSLPARLGARGALAVAGALHLITFGTAVQLQHLSAGRPLGDVAVAVAGIGLVLMYLPGIPVAVRFFPLAAIVGVAAALVPVLGGMP
jgi:4-hydroxybenzoate polyprenyltransferase